MSTQPTYTGPSESKTTSLKTFDQIYDHLTKTSSFPVLASPSPSPHNPAISHAIADLSIHPTLEALLHILNADLSSAHFLCRHMENRPAYEAMYIHGLLHRIEGDYRNAELWYKDVSESDVFQCVWPAEKGGLEGAHGFIQNIEKLRKEGKGDMDELEKESEREIEGIARFLKEKFGMDIIKDATEVWVEKPAKSKEAAAKMVVGGEGWRQF